MFFFGEVCWFSRCHWNYYHSPLGWRCCWSSYKPWGIHGWWKTIFFMFTAASLATVGYQSDPKIWWFGYLNEFMLFYYLWTLYQMLLMLTHYTKAFAMRSFSWGLQNPILDEALWLGFHEADPINCEPSCSWGLGFGACASTSQKGVQENNQTIFG